MIFNIDYIIITINILIINIIFFKNNGCFIYFLKIKELKTDVYNILLCVDND